jgi:8-oxo-dGTP diphosphatase
VRARVLVAAGALFRDAAGRVLLVEPNYKDTWEIPGGVVDVGESPRESCAREIGEELGLHRNPGKLLVVDYCRRPYAPWEGLRFVFDGGLLDDDEIARIALPADELESYRYVDAVGLVQLASPPLAKRILAALEVLPGETKYLENGEERWLTT